MKRNQLATILVSVAGLAVFLLVLWMTVTNPSFFDNVVFLCAATGAVTLSVLAVTRRSPIYTIINLLGVFLLVAIIFSVLGADLMAVLQLLVYAGAILMVFLFVVMLFNLGGPDPAAEERALRGEVTDRNTAEQDEAGFRPEGGGALFGLHSPKVRALVFSTALAVLLILPLAWLEGEHWDHFPPRHMPANGQVEDIPVAEGDTNGNPRDFFVHVDQAVETFEVPAAAAAVFGDRLEVNPATPDAKTVRVSWHGHMTVAMREKLLDTETDNGAWRPVVRQLYDMANWTRLELQGMTDRELEHIRNPYQSSGVAGGGPTSATAKNGFGSVARVGWDLFDNYLVPFEFVSLILLSAMVGVVVLALRQREEEEDEGAHALPTVKLFERDQSVDAGSGIFLDSTKRETVLPAEFPPRTQTADGYTEDDTEDDDA